MATTNTTPGNTSTDQRKASKDETRVPGQPDTQRKGAEQTQMGNAADRPQANPPKESAETSATKSVDRTDAQVAGNRTTGQNPTGTRSTNAEDKRSEDEEDLENTATEEDDDEEDEEDKEEEDEDDEDADGVAADGTEDDPEAGSTTNK